jgi:RNA polymerase sigma-70 factor (ECF subfamily)
MLSAAMPMSLSRARVESAAAMAEQPSGERELFDLASTGDRDAVGRLLERHLPVIEGFVRRHAGRMLLERESPSDVAQSVCREVLERLRDGRVRYEGEAPFRAWLQRAAVMKMMMRRRFWQAERRDAGVRHAPPPGASSDGGTPFVDSATPSRQAALDEELERLAAALASLPERYREVIAMHHVERLSHREIAERLSVTESHSRVLLSRALARLATLTD